MAMSPEDRRKKLSINSYCQGQADLQENITSPDDHLTCTRPNWRLDISTSTSEGQLAD